MKISAVLRRSWRTSLSISTSLEGGRRNSHARPSCAATAREEKATLSRASRSAEATLVEMTPQLAASTICLCAEETPAPSTIMKWRYEGSTPSAHRNKPLRYGAAITRQRKHMKHRAITLVKNRNIHASQAAPLSGEEISAGTC